MEQHIMIPSAFLLPPFFGKGEREIVYNPEHAFGDVMRNMYFVYDMAAVEGVTTTYQPWNKLEEAVPAVFSLWKEKKEEISLLFRQRKREEAGMPMIHFTAHLISILHWMNGRSVPSLQSMEQDMFQLQIKPLNAGERISFIVQGPRHYHSCIQLSELYEEAERQFFKQLAIKKARS